MIPLVTLMWGAPVAALATSTPPVARVVAAIPATTTAVRRACLSFRELDMAVSPAPAGRLLGRPAPSETALRAVPIRRGIFWAAPLPNEAAPPTARSR